MFLGLLLSTRRKSTQSCILSQGKMAICGALNRTPSACTQHQHQHQLIPTMSMGDEANPVVTGDNIPELEVFGLHSASNGRSCSVHTECGRSVQRGDVLRLVKCVVDIHGATETAVKAVKVIDGVDTCTVGFVPRVLKTLPKVQSHLDKFVQVIEIYTDSPNTYKRSLLHWN